MFSLEFISDVMMDLTVETGQTLLEKIKPVEERVVFFCGGEDPLTMTM